MMFSSSAAKALDGEDPPLTKEGFEADILAIETYLIKVKAKNASKVVEEKVKEIGEALEKAKTETNKHTGTQIEPIWKSMKLLNEQLPKLIGAEDFKQGIHACLKIYVEVDQYFALLGPTGVAIAAILGPIATIIVDGAWFVSEETKPPGESQAEMFKRVLEKALDNFRTENWSLEIRSVTDQLRDKIKWLSGILEKPATAQSTPSLKESDNVDRATDLLSTIKIFLTDKPKQSERETGPDSKGCPPSSVAESYAGLYSVYAVLMTTYIQYNRRLRSIYNLPVYMRDHCEAERDALDLHLERMATDFKEVFGFLYSPPEASHSARYGRFFLQGHGTFGHVDGLRITLGGFSDFDLPIGFPDASLPTAKVLYTPFGPTKSMCYLEAWPEKWTDPENKFNRLLCVHSRKPYQVDSYTRLDTEGFKFLFFPKDPSNPNRDVRIFSCKWGGFVCAHEGWKVGDHYWVHIWKNGESNGHCYWDIAPHVDDRQPSDMLAWMGLVKIVNTYQRNNIGVDNVALHAEREPSLHGANANKKYAGWDNAAWLIRDVKPTPKLYHIRNVADGRYLNAYYRSRHTKLNARDEGFTSTPRYEWELVELPDFPTSSGDGRGDGHGDGHGDGDGKIYNIKSQENADFLLAWSGDNNPHLTYHTFDMAAKPVDQGGRDEIKWRMYITYFNGKKCYLIKNNLNNKYLGGNTGENSDATMVAVEPPASPYYNEDLKWEVIEVQRNTVATTTKNAAVVGRASTWNCCFMPGVI